MSLLMAVLIGGALGCAIGAAWWAVQVRLTSKDVHGQAARNMDSSEEGLWLTITDTATAMNGDFLSVKGLLNNSSDRLVTVTMLDLAYRNHLHGIANAPQWDGLDLHNGVRTELPIVIDARKSVPFAVKGRYNFQRTHLAAAAEPSGHLVLGLRFATVDNRGDTHSFLCAFGYGIATSGGILGTVHYSKAINILSGDHFEIEVPKSSETNSSPPARESK